MFGFRLHPLFDGDGGIDVGGSAAASDTAPPSVAVDGNPSGTGNASVPGAEGTPAAPDVTHQESFATRLREERQKLEKDYEPLKGVQSTLERIAKAAGFDSHDAYLQALDEHVSAQAATREAQRLGVDPATYDQYFKPVNQELAQTKAELQKLQQAEAERQVRADIDALKAKYPDFDTYRDKTFDLAIQRGYSLEDAYIITSHADKLAAVSKETEQSVLANLANRESRQILPGNDKPGDTTLDVSKMSVKDLEAISRRVQNGERITLQ